MSRKTFKNKDCECFPCHIDVNGSDFNCMFCYCPLYHIEDCGGTWGILVNGVEHKDCSDCSLPHRGEKGWEFVQKRLRKND